MLGLNLLLLRYKRALSFILPAVVCLDACRNAYVVLKLYEEREKEWGLERQQVTLDEVLPLMRCIAMGCEVKDKAFWPPSLAQSVALPVPSEAADEVMALEDDDGPLGMLGVLPRSTSGYLGQALSDQELRKESVGHHSSTADSSRSTASSCCADATPPSLPYSRAVQWLAGRADQAAEAGQIHFNRILDRGLMSLRESIPMPCMMVRRRSAMRVRLQWHGFTQPSAKPQVVQTCEVYL